MRLHSGVAGPDPGDLKRYSVAYYSDKQLRVSRTRIVPPLKRMS